MGMHFRESLRKLESPLIQTIRGKGLLTAIVIDETKLHGKSAWDVCLMFKQGGLICKPTHGHIIRMAPPLSITREQIDECVKIIQKALFEIMNISGNQIPSRFL